MQDFHPNLPLLVTCAMDGSILIWDLPTALLDATPRFPSIPFEPPFRHPPSPISQSRSITSLKPPIFASSTVHPGQWPSFVKFASPVSADIISSAPSTYHDSSTTPRKSVKVWVPDILDGAPNSKRQELHQDFEKKKARFLSSGGGVNGIDSGPKRFPTYTLEDGVKWRSSSAFEVKSEVLLEGQHCIGDSVGYYRYDLQDEEGVQEPMLVVPTVAPVGGRDDDSGDGLYFFRPFAAPPLPTASSTSSTARPSSFSHTNLSRSTSLLSAPKSRSSTPLSSTATGQLVAPATRPHSRSPVPYDQKKQIAKLLYPPDRDRISFDYHHRLLPSSIAPLPPLNFSSSSNPTSRLSEYEHEQAQMEKVQGLTRESPHFRAVAVQPGGAEHVVAVGEGGCLAVWRRVGAGKGKGRAE
jgi:hypothetical protein